MDIRLFPRQLCETPDAVPADIQTTQFATITDSEHPFELFTGEKLDHATLAYETWGELNDDKSNVILLFHALSGSHHASGQNPHFPEVEDLWKPELHEGWWEEIVGPGKAVDTEKFFVICFNYIGGCYGSTGPSSIDPVTDKPYGSKFPAIHVLDQASAASRLLDQLGIETLHSVVGPSVGGLCALTFATTYPDRVKNVICVASGYRATVLNRLILFEQILAIENDRHFAGGDYYDGESPSYGLALARMISHKTFVHLDSIERRARSEVQQHPDTLSWYEVRDPFQSYMLHQGKKFVQRFDANTYLRIIDMWSRYHAEREARVTSPSELFAGAKAAGQRYLIFSIDSDFCFYPEEQAELVGHLEEAGIETMHMTVHSDKGHDSFLLEPQLYAPQISYLLNS